MVAEQDGAVVEQAVQEDELVVVEVEQQEVSVAQVGVETEATVGELGRPDPAEEGGLPWELVVPLEGPAQAGEVELEQYLLHQLGKHCD